MINITLPDDTVKEFESGVTSHDVAMTISEGLARNVLAAEVNGEVEINPDLVNDSPYDLGWIIILNPHDIDMENLLDPDEYVDFLAGN